MDSRSRVPVLDDGPRSRWPADSRRRRVPVGGASKEAGCGSGTVGFVVQHRGTVQLGRRLPRVGHRFLSLMAVITPSSWPFAVVSQLLDGAVGSVCAAS